MLSAIRNIFRRRPAAPASKIDRLTYAIGDIHGMLEHFRALMDKIRADAAALGVRPRLILLGDYIDRGAGSSQVLDEIIRLEFYNGAGKGWCDLEVLMGNHEQAMMSFLSTGDGGMWLKHGGETTLTSYNVPIPPHESMRDIAPLLRSELQDRFPAAHYDLISRMKYTFQAGDYLFVHAGVTPGKPLDEQGPDSFLWIRGEFLSASQACDLVVVHGHSPTYEPVNQTWRIGVDTGAYETGVLTAVRLLDDTREFLSVSL